LIKIGIYFPNLSLYLSNIRAVPVVEMQTKYMEINGKLEKTSSGMISALSLFSYDVIESFCGGGKAKGRHKVPQSGDPFLQHQ